MRLAFFFVSLLQIGQCRWAAVFSNFRLQVGQGYLSGGWWGVTEAPAWGLDIRGRGGGDGADTAQTECG